MDRNKLTEFIDKGKPEMLDDLSDKELLVLLVQLQRFTLKNLGTIKDTLVEIREIEKSKSPKP
jgi:hypothetical protein